MPQIPVLKIDFMTAQGGIYGPPPGLVIGHRYNVHMAVKTPGKLCVSVGRILKVSLSGTIPTPHSASR